MDAAGMFWWVAAVSGALVLAVIATVVVVAMLTSASNAWRKARIEMDDLEARKAMERHAYAAELAGTSSTQILKGGDR